MINIFFALIAVGAMCIDIILNREIIEEIDDESKEHQQKLKVFFETLDIPDKVSYIKKSNDKIDSLINKLQGKVKEGCASKKARPFNYTILGLSICVVISAIAEQFYLNNWIGGTIYKLLAFFGSIIAFGILFYYITKLWLIVKFNAEVEKERKEIRRKVEQTMYNAAIIAKDPTHPLDT